MKFLNLSCPRMHSSSEPRKRAQKSTEALLSLLRRLTPTTNNTTAHSYMPLALACVRYYESKLQAQLIPTVHPKLNFLTHQPNEPSDNNAYTAIQLFNYLYV